MLKKTINPTFPGKVKIPTYDAKGFEEIGVEFVYRDRTALKDFMSKVSTMSDVDVLMEVMKNWTGVEDPFSREAVEEYTKMYHGFSPAVFNEYIEALTRAKVKN